jgi:hypothetical protein
MAPSLDDRMRPAQVGRVDAAEVFRHRRAQRPGVDEIGHRVEDFVLALDVRRSEGRAREHEFEMDRGALAPDGREAEAPRVVDHAEVTLGP